MTSGNTSSAPAPRIIEDMHAPELFVSEVTGAAVAGDQAHVTFASFRRNASHTEGALVVNLRLVMPVSSFKRALAFMQAAVETVEQKK